MELHEKSFKECTLSKPLYGCYVVVYDWRFMTLEGQHYAISPDYSALTDDIFTIFRILKTLKATIITLMDSVKG